MSYQINRWAKKIVPLFAICGLFSIFLVQSSCDQSAFTYETLKESIISISGYNARSLDQAGTLIRYSVTGTAFFVSKSHLLTSLHGVEGAAEVFGFTSEGMPITLTIVAQFPEKDLAILSSDTKAGIPLKLAASPVRLGEEVAIVGTPGGFPRKLIAKQGIVSATDIQLEISENNHSTKVLLLDINSSRGFSGAPVINKSNQVVGMVLGRVFDSNPNINLGAFAIPASLLPSPE